MTERGREGGRESEWHRDKKRESKRVREREKVCTRKYDFRLFTSLSM